MQDGFDRAILRAVEGAASTFIECAAARPVAPGQIIAQYRIVEAISEGGMGVVYKALDTRLERLVALKFLFPGIGRDAGSRAQLEREARAASALNHPSICTVHAF